MRSNIILPYTHAHTDPYTYVYTHPHKHTHTHANTHAHTHTHVEREKRTKIHKYTLHDAHACTHAHVNLLVLINSLQTYNQNRSHRRLFARVYACVCRQKQSRKLWTKNLPPIGTALLARCVSLIFNVCPWCVYIILCVASLCIRIYMYV